MTGDMGLNFIILFFILWMAIGVGSILIKLDKHPFKNLRKNKQKHA
jgi:uncharacterized membrane protein